MKKLFILFVSVFSISAQADAVLACWVNGLNSVKYGSDHPMLKYDMAYPGNDFTYEADDLKVKVVAVPFHRGVDTGDPEAPLEITISDADGSHLISKYGKVWASTEKLTLILEDRVRSVQVACSFYYYIADQNTHLN